jgi:hypothetical protein
MSLDCLGHVSNIEGDYVAAYSLHTESLTIRREIGDRWGVAVGVGWLGEVAIALGQAQQGVRLLGASEALHEAIGAAREPEYNTTYERAVTSARSSLGEEAFQMAWQKGQAMTMEQAVEYALEPSATIQNPY